MSAGKFDLYIEQGTDFLFSAQIKDQVGNPIDLTGSSFAGKIRKYAASPTVVAAFTIAIGADPSNSWIDISLTKTQTSAIPAPTTSDNPVGTTEYFYDIEWTDGTAQTKRLLQGSVLVGPEVTY